MSHKIELIIELNNKDAAYVVAQALEYRVRDISDVASDYLIAMSLKVDGNIIRGERREVER